MLLLLRILFVILAGASALEAQTCQWATASGSNRNDNLGAMTADASGNTYITGSFSDTISFGRTSGAIKIESEAPAIYLAKFDPAGQCIFARRIATGPVVSVLSIAVDPGGAIVMTGRYLSSAQFGSSVIIPLQSLGGYDAYVARIDEDGEVLWVRSMGGAGSDFGGSVCTDAQSNVYVTGDFHITQFDGSGSKIFVHKYAPNGDTLWMKRSLEDRTGTYGNAIAADANGNIYVLGQYFADMQFEGSEKLDAGNIESNIFLLKFGSAGELVWSRTAGAGSGYAGGFGLAMDNASNVVYLTGFYRGTIDFGSHSLSSPSGMNNELFVAKCTSAGDFLWAARTGGPASYGGIATANDKCYLTGSFTKQLDLGSIPLIAHGVRDCFLAQLNSVGTFESAISFGGDTLTTSNGLATSSGSGDLFVAGKFLKNIRFGSAIKLSGDTIGFDLFVSRFKTATGGVAIAGSESLSLSPIPAHDRLRVTGIDATTDYRIIDLRGVEVAHGAGHSDILIESLPPGAYILELNNDQFSRRFVKE